MKYFLYTDVDDDRIIACAPRAGDDSRHEMADALAAALLAGLSPRHPNEVLCLPVPGLGVYMFLWDAHSTDSGCSAYVSIVSPVPLAWIPAECRAGVISSYVPGGAR